MPSPSARSLASLPLAAIVACSPAGAASPGRAAQPTVDTAAATCAAPGAEFCWVNPLPQGNPILGAWLSAAGDGWAVGPPGAVLRWDGTALTGVALPAALSLRAVWGSAPTDVWAAGDAILHFDGRAWTPSDAPVGPWNAVHGTSASDVWAVGVAGAVAHYDGARWSRVAFAWGDDLSAVAVVGATEAWAASATGGTVYRWDGVAWSVATRVAARSLAAIAAARPGDVWAGGDPQPVNAAAGVRPVALFHLSAGTWEPVPVTGLEGGRVTALAASGAGDPVALGVSGSGDGVALRNEASGWTVEALPSSGLAPRFTAAAPGLTLAVGDGGQAWVRRGSAAWTSLHDAVSGYLQAASTAPGGDAWFAAVLPGAGGAATALVRVSDGSVGAVSTGLADVVYGVWAIAPDDVWAGTLRHGFLHYDGTGWTAGVGGSSGLVDGVWASGPNDVWGVAGTYALHFDGSTVTRFELPGGGARRIFGTSPRDAWAVGGTGLVQHWDGTAWSAVGIPGGPVLGVWGASPGDVWMVGYGGLALHWDGRALTRVDTGTSVTLWAVAGSSASDVWVAGANGTVLHLDGGGFRPVATGTRNALASVAVTSREVYVAGEFGTVLRRAL